MATSIHCASDETFDFTCSVCKKEKRTREATKYCVECNDYYCNKCVEIHGKVPFMECHTILGKLEFPTNVASSLVTVPTDRCPLHPTKLQDMYCQNDDEIGCHACMAVKHRSCIDVVYIPEEIDNLYNEGDINRLETDLTKVKLCLKDFVKSRQNDIEQVSENKVIALVKIKDFRQKVNTTLDQLEKATINEFESHIKALTDKINKTLDAMDIALKDIESCQQHLESTEKNQSQQFVCLKKGQQKLLETEKLRKAEEKSSQIANIEFEEDPTIEALMTKLNTLGKLIEKSNSNLHQVAKQSTPYKVTTTNSYNVKISGDKYDCVIMGSCIMKSGNILLIDCNNKKLKKLHGTTYKVIDQCDLLAGPRAVCEIEPQEAAVTLGNTIQVVSMGRKMTLTRTIQTNYNCYGLAFSRGEMFVSDHGKQVCVYDLSGTLLRTISKDQSVEDIFSDSRNIAISDDGNTVYVTDYNEGVVTMNRQGRVISRFTDPQLKGVRGVCTDGSGSVLVCGNSSYNVMQIGPSGNNLGVIANNSDGVVWPLSVCYDGSHSRMIVTNESSSNCNNITVLDLVQT